MPDKYKVTRIAEIPTAVPPDPDSFEWKPIRHHLGIRSFGINAGVAANAGDWVVEDHTEDEGNSGRHEELYFVATGSARFAIDGEEFDAPAGTLVFVPGVATRRSARAQEPGTTVLYVGGRPGAAFEISAWERRHFDD